MSRLLIAVFFICLILTPSHDSLSDQNLEAPFGLQWGMSADQVRTMGVVLGDKGEGDYGIEYSATKLPKVLNDLETVELYFDYNDHLWRVAAVSHSFANDPYGAAVQSRYDELSEILSSKYGAGTHHHAQDTEIYKNSSEFLMGIHAGRSWHYTDYASANVAIQLIIRASDMNTGYYVLVFTNTAFEKEFQVGKKQHEKGAL
jgi:hypothetical protein